MTGMTKPEYPPILDEQGETPGADTLPRSIYVYFVSAASCGLAVDHVTQKISPRSNRGLHTQHIGMYLLRSAEYSTGP
jgi:hypothetical protein